MRALAALALLAAALVSSSGCARKKRAPGAPPAPVPGWTETGAASWYGYPYHGRRAANGEVYDMEQLTAAHRTLPFGALVLVTNLSNRRSVTVRITDRGPFVEGRIIDLSRAAARQIGLIGPGTAPVRIEFLGYAAPPQLPEAAVFAVQAGAFADLGNASELRERLRKRYDPVEIISPDGPGGLHRVLVGRFPTMEEAEAAASALREEVEGVFVVRVQ